MDRLSCRYEKIKGRKDKKTKSLEKEKDKVPNLIKYGFIFGDLLFTARI